VLPAAQSDQRPHAGVFPTPVRVDLGGPRFDGERTRDGSGDLAEGGGFTTMTIGRMADEETKDAKPKSSSPWSSTLLGHPR
ncbi:MAG TPA: hypothetical protein VFM05_04940, partial [Candidatus Saccharimonadales bacterium]|nr:hypothetical protein [Candidatus Saccharimonadales bacterium]